MIFSDPILQEQFDKDGFISIHFLSEEEIQQLSGAFRHYEEMGGSPIEFAKDLNYHISVFDTNIDRRIYIDTILKSIFTKKVEEVLPGYRILNSNFMTKKAGGGEIEVHQDFSHVDEKLYTAFNLWVPLQDTDEHNGGFFLIRGSNKLFSSYRSATIPHNLTHYNESFKKHMEPIRVKAGDGLLFDHKLFHYSCPNTSSKVRVAVQMVVIPKNTQPVMYQYDEKNDPKHLEVFELTEEFLLTKNLWEKTEGLRSLGKVPYEKIPDAKDILKKLNGQTAKPNLLKRILGYV